MWIGMKKNVKQQKIQRTNNPRFLGALGFLGFLGFLGARNPEVQQWAKLSWLSLFSLLVLFPTMDINSPKASYRLNPRRKWMLVFLAGLGFLAFLHTDHHDFVGLAMVIPMLAQFAIDHKKKAAVPLKELRRIFVLMFVAVILPLGGMVWFMTAAVRNEQMAVRQRLTEVYESQLNAAFLGLDKFIQGHRSELTAHDQLSSARRFDALVRDSIADSILVLDGNGSLLYPANLESEFKTSSEGLVIRAKVRSLLKAGAVSNACKQVEHMAGDDALRDARDEFGRLILPALQLFCLQSAPEAHPILEALQKTVTDYSTAMPSARRLFYLQSLSRLGAEVEPWLGAETLATELEDLVFPLTVKKYWPVPGKELFLLFSEDRRTAAVFNGTKLLQRLQGQVEASSSVEGVRIELEQEQAQAWQSRSFPMLGGDWVLGLHVEGDDPFSDTADRRIVRYIWIGNMVIAGMIFVFVLLVRSLLAQQKLTRMKNDFVATITHELKTPLASTRMLVDTMLEGRCESETQQREYLELIARENKRLSRLIDNFLTFSRMERNKKSLNFEDVAPGDIARTAVETVHENYEQCGCILTVDVSEPLPVIVADKDSMVQVLLNLLDNACKYSNGEKKIAVRIFEKEHAVCFEVKDNGIGMAKRELSKIMERFYQVDQSLTRKVGGAGLGLSIVSFIVDAHGGKIDIQSELGKGSTFTVKLPASDTSGEV